MAKEYRAFNISMPEPIIPIYDFLQNELNTILNDETYRKELQSIDLKKRKGNIWLEMRDIFKPRLESWKINNKTWYSYILYENLRRELKSKKESMTIWKEYLLNDKKINQELFDILIGKYKIYATRGQIENIASHDAPPELAREAVFQLDYSISEKQMFRVNKYNPCLFEIKVGPNNTDWIGYLIEIPNSINKAFNGRIAKPRFMKRKSDGKYIGICSYEVNIENNEESYDNIMGVDIGKVNLYSAIVINNGEIISPRLLPSKKLEKLNKKLKRLQNERELLFQKMTRVEAYNVENQRQDKRKRNYSFVRHKISNLTTYMANLVALELSSLAKEYKCKEIHVENLSWLKSEGQKWNHSEMFTKIEAAAKIKGIKVVFVNACNSSKEHPISKEIGKEEDRNIKFLNGKYIDRDLLASINLAARNKTNKKEQKINKIKVPQKKRTKLNKSRKKEILDSIKSNRVIEIVVSQPGRAELLEKFLTLIKCFAAWKSISAHSVYTSSLNRYSLVSTRYKDCYL